MKRNLAAGFKTAETARPPIAAPKMGALFSMRRMMVGSMLDRPILLKVPTVSASWGSLRGSTPWGRSTPRPERARMALI